jgi:hypothetical protein
MATQADLNNISNAIDSAFSTALAGGIPYPIQPVTVTVTVTPTMNINSLIIAGGGGGGKQDGGGGGAGGVLTTSFSISAGTVINVNVGLGGSGATPSTSAVNGGDSFIYYTYNTSVTSIAYGGGGEGLTGGSGGGQAALVINPTIGLGTLTQGFSGGHNSFNTGGGGGGAGGPGSSYSGFGPGGIGIINPVPGSTIGQLSAGNYWIAGGGAGGNGYATGPGGLGGGGGLNGGGASSGLSYTGGGGGGAGVSSYGGQGGSGAVVISYVSPKPLSRDGIIKNSGSTWSHAFTSTNTFTLTSVYTETPTDILNSHIQHCGNNITDNKNLFNFIKGCYDLGIWYNIVCWPMKFGQNSINSNTIYSLGGINALSSVKTPNTFSTLSGLLFNNSRLLSVSSTYLTNIVFGTGNTTTVPVGSTWNGLVTGILQYNSAVSVTNVSALTSLYVTTIGR